MAALPDISTEIRFRTARSGGKGGQHVNKVETMVEGLFDIRASALLQEDEKALVFQRLQHRINRAGILQVRSQAGRSQAENKKRVVERMTALVRAALIPEKPRKATRPSASSREERLADKKRQAEKKEQRRRPWP